MGRTRDVSKILTSNTSILTLASASATYATIESVGETSLVGVSLYKSTSQSAANNTNTAITFNEEAWDTDGFHSTVTNTDRITIPSGKDGKYLITSRINTAPLQANGSYRVLEIQKNGSVVGNGMAQGPVNWAAQNVEWYTSVNQVVDLVATDYITMHWYQNSGTSHTIAEGQQKTILQAIFLGA